MHQVRNYLDPFQFDFRPSYGAETVMVALLDDLPWEMNRSVVEQVGSPLIRVFFCTVY